MYNATLFEMLSFHVNFYMLSSVKNQVCMLNPNSSVWKGIYLDAQ